MVTVVILALFLCLLVCLSHGAFLWMTLSFIVGTAHTVVAIMQGAMLWFDIFGFTCLRTIRVVRSFFSSMNGRCCRRTRRRLEKQLRAASTYDEWRIAYEQLQEYSMPDRGEGGEEQADARSTASAGSLPAQDDEAGESSLHDSAAAASQDEAAGNTLLSRIPLQLPCNGKKKCSLRRTSKEPHVEAETDEDVLMENIRRLSADIAAENMEDLMLALRGQVMRNHGGSAKLYSSPSRYSSPRSVVVKYMAELRRALEYLADCRGDDAAHLQERLGFFRHCRTTHGRTALVLSGGGSLAMYHMGVVRALIAQGLLPKVISGTSGGTIVVAMMAMHTDEELMNDIFVREISTCHAGYVWFPSLFREVLNFVRFGVLVRSEEFHRTARRYYGDTTFAEAYARTGRICCMNVSTHGSEGRTGATMLLNHITAPDVTIASAVATSCAMPGIMGPRPLMAKTKDGKLVKFEACGKNFVDGTMHGDYPKRKLTEMFQCSQFMISQVNPHIAPFIRRAANDRQSSRLQKFEDWMATDIKHRVQVLSDFNLMPTLFGRDIKPFVTQKWVEDKQGIMLVPQTLSLVEAPAALQNPSRRDMQHYILEGQRCVWGKVEQIRHLMAVENILDDCIAKLEHLASKNATRPAPKVPAAAVALVQATRSAGRSGQSESSCIQS
eukprot:TRINITY_DN20848_c0_g1_i1.p1 TRINITY_DN20848_c0_g1~~TRINITY_DN20848_c0_g1_i1.p1  ORF type:complete len:667 (+),score=128.04 TRINITY_DN20848_c0_g1_i1:86-2086(+)